MIVSATSSKRATDSLLRVGLVPLLTAVCVTGCGAGDPPEPITAAPAAAPPQAAAPVTPQPAAAPEPAAIPEIVLKPLPTPEQVIAAAPGGRQDPFQPLPLIAEGLSIDGEGAQQGTPSGALVLTGVIAVGGSPRALVRLDSGNGVLCLGEGGWCEGDAQSLLPKDWSVVAIDLDRACVQLSLDGEAQDPVCIA